MYNIFLCFWAERPQKKGQKLDIFRRGWDEANPEQQAARAWKAKI